MIVPVRDTDCIFCLLYVKENAKNGCVLVKRYGVRKPEIRPYAVRNLKMKQYAVRKGVSPS